MNNWRIVVVTAILSWAVSPARAQGPLTPPGAPGETMKTLAQVEPRIPIPGGSSPFTINQQGSYYLVTNMFRTLTIAANNVTVDLMGYIIASTSGDALDIPIGTGTNTLVRNGTLRPATGNHALDARYADDCVFENLRIDGNGAWCGIYADDRCIVRNCEVRGCNNRGISVGRDSEVSNCRVIGGTLDGVQADHGCRIVDNVIEGHGDDGLYITGSDCYVAGNRVKGNADNYEMVQGNQLNLLLCEVPETLDWPCSVKFIGTLACSVTGTNGITVNASGVSIDLDGHGLIGPGAASLSGIYQTSAYRDLKICNGFVANWIGTVTADAGIRAVGDNAMVSSIQASTNNTGITIGRGGAALDCAATYNKRDGIYAIYGNVISRCTTAFNDGAGIIIARGATVHDCTSYRNSDGFSALGEAVITGCIAYDNSDDGFDIGSNARIADCTATDNSGDGIQLTEDCLVTGNTCCDNGSSGIFVMGDDNRIDSNHASDNNKGIDVNGIDNLVVRNSAEANGTDYEIVAGNSDAQVLTFGSGFSCTEPWANFSL
ncbi:MAG: hypothetical protein EOM20_17685 [Spartobacteria bacterium]|nr:hypothetical protein [Spartobacteria bacterium]